MAGARAPGGAGRISRTEGPNRLAAQRREGLLAREVVLGFDVTYRSGLRPHDGRMDKAPAGKAARTAQHRAVGDAGRGKHDIAMRHVEESVFAVEIGDAEGLRAAALSASASPTS